MPIDLAAVWGRRAPCHNILVCTILHTCHQTTLLVVCELKQTILAAGDQYCAVLICPALPEQHRLVV